jgi:uncharacterized protein (DUF924 family)
MSVEISDILFFWFEETEPKQWFVKNAAFDAEIEDRFAATYEAAVAGNLDGWAETPEGCAALVIVLDQFPRNMFRGDARSFATDAKSLALTKFAIEQGWLDDLPLDQAKFLITPLMHSENLRDQEIGVPLFEKYGNDSTLDYAIKHRDVIARFGRFPHRNEVLGRESTAEEKDFINTPGTAF